MSKEEYELARLATKCAGLQGKIDDQAAEMASLQALWSIAHAERSEAMLELAKYKSLCDQMAQVIQMSDGCLYKPGEEALEAWRAMG